MALVDSEQLAAPWRGMYSLPVLRQAGLLVGLALAVALGVAVVLWSQSPNYRVLGPNMPERVKPEVMAALQTAGIQYKLASGSGAIMVPAADLARAELQLSAAGIAMDNDQGFELLSEEQAFGVSSRMEVARLQRALEGELARSIRALRSVEQARVHLALPQRSVFVRDRTEASASVVLRLFPGRRLDEMRIIGIQQLVAAAVPELMPEDVAVLDDQGRLLSSAADQPATAMSGHYLAMTREVEKTLVERINDLLEPMFGRTGIRAQVTAQMDFSEVETTLENYNPNNREDVLLRSEQRSVSRRLGDAAGVPGALTNQPPQQPVLVDGAPIASTAQAEQDAANLLGDTQEVRNYELDRLIEHVRASPGRLSRLSVAVLVDRAAMPAPLDLEAEEAALAAGEDPNAELLATVEELVREAVGLQAQRGDSIRVSAMDFRPRDEQPLDELPSPPLWEEPWLLDLLRQLGGIILIIVLLLSVLRPTLKILARPGLAPPPTPLPGGDTMGQLGGPDSGAPRLAPDGVQDRLAYARQVVDQDPKRVAQLTRAWLAGDE